VRSGEVRVSASTWLEAELGADAGEQFTRRRADAFAGIQVGLQSVEVRAQCSLLVRVAAVEAGLDLGRRHVARVGRVASYVVGPDEIVALRHYSVERIGNRLCGLTGHRPQI